MGWPRSSIFPAWAKACPALTVSSVDQIDVEADDFYPLLPLTENVSAEEGHVRR